MSGHSKWSTIKRKKEINDKARAQVFSKLSRIITLAVFEGGGIADPAGNVGLRIAIDRARAANMPRANIDRAIEKAKRGGADNLREVVYEGFAPGGVSLIISATTDNPNRALSEIKNKLEKLGGKLGSEHSVMYQFVKCGVVEFDENSKEDDVYSFADSIGALDIEVHNGAYFVYIPFDKIGYVAEYVGKTLESRGADIFYKPQMTVSTTEQGIANIDRIVDALEELDDVDSVYTNLNII